MAIECHIVTADGRESHAHTFEVIPRIGEVIVLPQPRSTEIASYRVKDVLHYPHAMMGTSERARLIVTREE